MSNKLKPYVRYDANWKVVPSSLILRSEKPKSGRWGELQLVTDSSPTTTNHLRAFVRYDASYRPVAGSLIFRVNKPKVGKWKEVYGYNYKGDTPLPPIPMSITLSTQSSQTSAASCLLTDFSQIVYATGLIGPGTVLYTDQALTIRFVATNLTWYKVQNQPITLNITDTGTIFDLAGCN